MPRASLICLALAACAVPLAPVPPEPGKQERRAILQDPARVHELFFAYLGHEETYAKAHELLTPDAKAAMPYEAFYLGVTEARNLVPEGFRHFVKGLRQHRALSPDDLEAVVRWCNPDMGWSRDIRLKAQKLGKYRIWGIELSREDLDSLKGGLLAWYRRQKRADGDQRLVHPPGWAYASVDACACTR